MRFSSLFVLFIFLGSVEGALASETEESSTGSSASRGNDTAAAEILFQKGRDAMEAGDLETACESFAESHRLDPAAGTVMNLATCEEKLGQLASAWEHWQRALRLLPSSDRRSDFARSRVEALEADLPRLTIVLSKDAPSDASILRDGTELRRAARGIAMPANPGVHQVTVRKAGFRDRTYEVTLERGKTSTLEVSVGQALPKDELNGADRRKGGRGAALALGGVGVLGVVGAVVTGALLPAKKRQVQDNCDADSRACNEEGATAARQGRTLIGLNTASWIVGAVGLGAGAALYLTLGPKRTAKSGIQAGLSLGDGARVSVRGAF